MEAMKSLCVVVVFAISIQLSAQDLKPTYEFKVEGDIEKEIVFSATELAKLKVHNIGDVVITNHLGEKRSDAKALKGVLLRDVLEMVKIKSESPKVLSEFYFICKANDGYIVTYSWNEVFNSTVGESAYIITEKEGKNISQMEGAITMLSPKDFKTGRRHVKALESIIVRRAK